ncbi:uncharacterized protein LOC129301415 [Prosopis cineraria]|uniref:uncharacterized protein LOC129301415 n=1 Tax=Prosopis cineraria TaxID=364024 RepID=UPI00240FD282|nr:uncharacterized protein LOC129301415 [Prosopis cineraria]
MDMSRPRWRSWADNAEYVWICYGLRRSVSYGEVTPHMESIDVPEGFLLEWWKVNCDFASLREWLNQREKPSMEATQEHNDSQSGKFFMHSEINKQLLIDYASGTFL